MEVKERLSSTSGTRHGQNLPPLRKCLPNSAAQPSSDACYFKHGGEDNSSKSRSEVTDLAKPGPSLSPRAPTTN